MDQPPKVASPFMQTQPLRPSVNTLLILLLMVVAAGGSLLVYYALQVPAITSEWNAWLGRPDPVVDTPAGRAAQLKFLLVVYSAPLVLGLLVYGLHYVLQLLEAWNASRQREEDDEQYRME